MTDYTQPLADPVLEAGARIRATMELEQIETARRVVTKYPILTRKGMTEAARQIDHLRAIGAIPDAEPISPDTLEAV